MTILLQAGRKYSEMLKVVSLLLVVLLHLAGNLVQAQPEFRDCYDAQGQPTRCEPVQKSFSFESVPTTNSTCGSPSSPFCIRSVSLGRISSDCTGVCDASDPENSHPPELITDFVQLNTWWQSENSLATQNVVVIDIPLGTLVEIGLIVFNFQSLIPSNFRVLKSEDFGVTYTDFHYFATSCLDQYSIPDSLILSLENETTVLCQTVNTPPLPGQITFFTVLDRPSTNDSTPGFSEALYSFMTATDIRILLLEHYEIPNLDTSDFGYYYAMRDVNVLGTCQCHGHASECRVDSDTGRYYCACQHNTTGDFCERCSDFYQDVPWQRSTGATEFECQPCNCSGQSEQCRFDADVFEASNGVSGGVCINCRNNRAGRQCERCDDFFYPMSEGDSFTCSACECNLAGVSDDGRCAQAPVGDMVSTGDCMCKQNTEGRTCGTCRTGFFNLSSENSLGCQACECSVNGSLSSRCDPVTGACNCKPNTQGDACDRCIDGFFMPDPTSEEGCRPCNCNLGGSTSMQCNQLTGACVCRAGVQGSTCSEVQDNYFFRGIDYLILEAENARGISEPTIIIGNGNQQYTGTGFYGVQDEHGPIDFGSLTAPVSGLYEVVIRYSFLDSLTWNSSTLTVFALGGDDTETSTGSIDCRDLEEVTGQASTAYTSWMRGVGLSITRNFCLRGGNSYQFVLSDFVSGRSDIQAVLNLDSLVLIPVYSSELAVFGDAVISRDYDMCVAQYHSLATRPSSPMSCSQTVFTVSTAVYDGAAPCDCDTVGTMRGSVCAAFGGQCSCLPGVRGRRCDQCLPGFNNLTSSGCTGCACNPLGSVGQLCDPTDGSCMCIRNVTGQTCSSCIENYWGFGSDEGCRPCTCNATGSVSLQCNSLTGLCQCRDGVNGGSCDRCQDLAYGFSDDGCSMCDCNTAGSTSEGCDVTSGQCSCLPTTMGRDCSQCRQGTFNLRDTNPNGCQPCFCSGQSSLCSSAPGFFYTLLASTFNGSVDSALQGWRLTGIDGSSGGPGSGMLPLLSLLPGDDSVILQAESDTYLEAPTSFVGNKLSSYSQYLEVEVVPVDSVVTIESISEQDVILVGSGMTLGARFSRTDSGFRVHLLESAGWLRIDVSPSVSATTQEFQLILSSLSRILISASFNTDVILRSISLVTTIHESETMDSSENLMQANSVEQCQCPANYTGLSCEDCASGYTRSTSGACELCECNGFSADCNPNTGECQNCTGSTTGASCEVCARGFYGDPRSNIPCRPCPCPLTEGPGQFTDECVLRVTDDVIGAECLGCPSGHTGLRCESCIGGYFGDPIGSLGTPTTCSDCQCSGNIDTGDPESCNRLTGVCTGCLGNTAGNQCERCADGFYGDAITARNCTECGCHLAGSTSGVCNPVTGFCPCRANVTGMRCDQCLPGFYGLDTPSGCVSCDCNPVGSVDGQCDESGACLCDPGVTGQLCDRCLPGYFGFSNTGCENCSCSPINSDSALCDESDGTCICRPGSTGARCELCLQNHFQTEDGCTSCPECYQDLEEVYNTSLNALTEEERNIENLTQATSDLIPFDDRVLIYQNEISRLQSEASDVLSRQNDLFMLYNEILFTINVTLRGSVADINDSLDTLRERFTTIYIITLSSQELMNTTIREFGLALDFVRRVETVTVPSLRTLSESIRSDSLYVEDLASELESNLTNFSSEVESLQNATDEITLLINSILSIAGQISDIQDSLIAEVANISTSLAPLDSDLSSINYRLSDAEMRLLSINDRIQSKSNSLVDVPDANHVTSLIRSANETDSFIRNEVINEILNQSSRLSELNTTYTAQRSEAEDLFQQVSNLGANVSMLLEQIQTALGQASALLESSEELIRNAEMVTENLENFNNDTFRIGEQVDEAMQDIEEINNNATAALNEAQALERTLEGSEETLTEAKEVALEALNTTNTTLQALSSVDTERLVTSANASAESSLASMNAASELSDRATDYLEQMQSLSETIDQQEAEVGSARSQKDQAEQDRDSAVSAVEQLRMRLDSMDLIDPSALNNVRDMVAQTRSKLDSADLSGVYQTLVSRLEEQRAIRRQLQEELDGLTDDIEHLRRVNRALPDPDSGCGEGGA